MENSSNLKIKFDKWVKETLNEEKIILLDFENNLQEAFTKHKQIFENMHIDDLHDIFKIIDITLIMFEYVHNRNENKHRLTTDSPEKLFVEFEKNYFNLKNLKNYVDGESSEIINSLLKNTKELLFDLDVLKNKYKIDKNNFHLHWVDINNNKNIITNKQIDSHVTYKSELEYRNIQDNYKSLTDSYLGLKVISYNDIMRISLIKLQVLIPDVFDSAIKLIFEPIYKLYTQKKLSHNSLIKNKHLIKYYAIILPNICRDYSIVYLSLEEDKYKDKKVLVSLELDDEISIADNFNTAFEKVNKSKVNSILPSKLHEYGI